MNLNFSSLQIQDENPSVDEIGRERQSVISEISVPQISQIQRVHPRTQNNLNQDSQMISQQRRANRNIGLSQLRQPVNVAQHISDSHGRNTDNEDLVDEQEQDPVIDQDLQDSIQMQQDELA
jgi:hypothetical protein